MKQLLTILSVLAFIGVAQARTSDNGDYLIKVTPDVHAQMLNTLSEANFGAEDLGIGQWIRVQVPAADIASFQSMIDEQPEGILHVQPNYKVQIPNMMQQLSAVERQQLADKIEANGPFDPVPPDNPDFIDGDKSGSGADPMFNEQWGMNDIGVREAWNVTRGNSEIVVAVIDTGVDYTHEDLVDNMWQNPGETGTDAFGNDKATNGLDDDNNGYVDDIVGWDFVSNDNKPYDFTTSVLEMLFGGGNPGHGTHCAGNVAARGENGKGIAGVAPNVKIMAIRFLSEKGQGTTADAIKAVRYGVDNGAHVLSNSWGSSGEDPNDRETNEALREAIRYSESMGRLFVAAAGNGDATGNGYDNDTSNTPAFPASYDMDIIVSVAALDDADNFGTFSNWGRETVDLGAPGVRSFSTTPGNNYTDTVLDLFGTTVTWDGTSMATPHVAGAAALYLSANPEASWQQVKQALMDSTVPVNALSNKLVTGGKLNVQRLMGQ